MRLPVIAHYEYLRGLRIPEGIFLPEKAGTKKLEYSETAAIEETSADADDDDTRSQSDSSNSQGMRTGGSLAPSSPRPSPPARLPKSVPSPPTNENM
jgi:hypothetical protein